MSLFKDGNLATDHPILESDEGKRELANVMMSQLRRNLQVRYCQFITPTMRARLDAHVYEPVGKMVDSFFRTELPLLDMQHEQHENTDTYLQAACMPFT